MILLFRFLFTIFKGGFRPRVGPLDSSVVRFTVLPHDCDLNIHLNAGRFVSFMDIARIELLVRMGALRPVLKKGWRPVVGGLVIRYRRSVEPFERFTIESRLVGWDEKWFYIEHTVNRRDGSMAAIAYARTLLRKKDGTVEPAEVIDLLGFHDVKPPALPAFVEQWKTSEDQR